jgi:hypothetical protein
MTAEKTKPIPVRLDADMIERLDRVVKDLGFGSRTAVIRLCISTFIDYLEKHGTLMLPPDWEHMLKQLDNRTHRYKNQPRENLKAAEGKVSYGTKTEDEGKEGGA